MASQTAIYQNHAAALSRHQLECGKNNNNKQDNDNSKQDNSLSAAVRRAFSSPSAPFSCNATPSLNTTQPAQAHATRNTSSALDTPDSRLHKNPNQTHSVVARRQRQTGSGCFGFSCKRRLSASSTGNVYCRRANIATDSHRYKGMLTSSPVMSASRREANGLENTRPVVKPVTPFVPRRPNASNRGPSLNHPQPRNPHSRWVDHSVTPLPNTIASNPKGVVPHTERDTRGSSAKTTVTDTIIGSGDTSSTKGRFASLPNISPQRLVTKKRASIYISDGCWGCEDVKAIQDKETGLCRSCELYLIPCIDWTPERMVETPEREEEEVESPTLGESASYIHIIGSRGAWNPVPPVNTIPETSILGVKGDYVSLPQSHFSDYTSALSSSSRTRHISSCDKVILDEEESEEIQELCRFWYEIEKSFRSSEAEQLILRPDSETPGSMKCVLGPPSPERICSKPAIASTGKVALPKSGSLASRRSQKAAISGLGFPSDNPMAMRSRMGANGQEGPAEPKPNTGTSRTVSSIYSLYLEL